MAKRKLVWKMEEQLPQTPLAGLLTEHITALRVRDYSENTIRNQHMHVRYFLEWCFERGLIEPTEITRPVLERYQRHLFHQRKRDGDPLSFRSQNTRLIALRTWFRWMTRQNHILHNPASELELPRLPYRLPRHVLTMQEAEQVLQQPDIHDPIGLRDRAILEVLYSTGMRRMEVVGLKLYDLDFDRGTIMIRLGKGKKDRFVPVGDRAVAWLQKYVRESRSQLSVPPDTGTLFLTHAGDEISRDVLTMVVRAYVVQAKTGKTGACHLFRHTMATLMLEGGADIRFIQEMLGHAKLETTQIYTRVSIRMLKQIHSASHPAAQLKRDQADHAMLVQTHIWPNEPPPTAEELFAALDSESDDESDHERA
jgi:integrase/recombinase XerD